MTQAMQAYRFLVQLHKYNFMRGRYDGILWCKSVLVWQYEDNMQYDEVRQHNIHNI